MTCPFSASNLNRDSPAEYVAAHVKHRKYDEDFKDTNYDFSALLFESTGAVNREGKEVLKQLFRFAARYSGRQLSVYAGRAWARLSCTLQSAVAQSVINRTPDFESSSALMSDDDFETPLSSFSLVAIDESDHADQKIPPSSPHSMLRPAALPFTPSLGPADLVQPAGCTHCPT